MTVGNYVRNLSGPGAAAAHRHRSRAPTSPCQFRMQFPSGIALVRIGLRRCVTCVFELHAKFVWTRPCRRPPHRWGLVSCWRAPTLPFGTKFSLLGFLVVTTVQNSPCMSKKRQIEPFRVSWESFVPEVGPCGSCWESFVPHMRWEGACWESFVPHMRWEGVCWESFVPHMRCEGVCWESFVPEVGPCGSCWESFVPKRRGVVLVGRDLFRRGTFRVCSCRAYATHRRPSLTLGPCSALDTGGGGGFAPCKALWRRVASVSHPCMAQFPPFGSGAAVVCSGVALKSQTTSVKNTENGLLVAKWSALWAQRCLAWCACSHANPLLRA